MGYSKTVVVSDTGGVNSGKILEFNPRDLENVIIQADQDIFWGYNDSAQAIFPLASGNAIVLTHQDFSTQAKIQNQRILIFAKRQAVGNANVYINYMGKPI